MNGTERRTPVRYLTRPIAALLVVAVAGCASAPAPAPAERGNRYELYFLGGQSNMDGFGFTAELPGEWLADVDRVMIYTGKTVADNEPGGGAGTWDRLRPGHGTGFDTDGQVNLLSDRFGPELAFGRTLAELDPTTRIAIIKYSRGGSSLALGASGYGSWAPDFVEGAGSNQYDNALTAIRRALAQRDVDGDGRVDELVPAGIVWMQGEADAYHSSASADAYQSNLQQMMDLLRAALRVGDLPVVIGKITDSGQADDGTMMDYIGIVQTAQQAFVRTDGCAAFVTVTDGLRYLDDGWHYDTDGYLKLGAAFARAAADLASSCRPVAAPDAGY